MIFLLQQHQQTLLNQLREVTGTTDVQLLQQALQVHFETQAKNWKSQGYCVYTVDSLFFFISGKCESFLS